MPSAISSAEKFFAFARRPKASPPIYTASAPKVTAVFRTSRLPAGIRSSGLFFVSFIVLFLFPLYADRHAVPHRKDGGYKRGMMLELIQVFPHPGMDGAVSS